MYHLLYLVQFLHRSLELILQVKLVRCQTLIIEKQQETVVTIGMV